MMNQQIILGLDPGSIKTGYAILSVNLDKKSSIKFIDSGCIKSNLNNIDDRLKAIINALSEIISIHLPNVIVMEKVFVYKNPASALKLGQSRGALLAAIYNVFNNINLKNSLIGKPNMEPKIIGCAPAKVKKAITGNGRATKDQIKYMVKILLPEIKDRNLVEDEADAIALALCHLSVQ